MSPSNPDGLVALASSMLGRDLAATEGRTLDSLRLTGQSVAEMKQIFEAGP